MSQTFVAKNTKYAAVSVDLDALWCYREIHGMAPRSDESFPTFDIGIPRMLDFFESLGINATLFTVGKDLTHTQNVAGLVEAVERGHEVANHSFHHRYNLRDYEIHDIRQDIRDAHEIIVESIGVVPNGFRTPGYNLDARILSVAAEMNYLYDSSIFPCPPYFSAKAAVMAWRKISRSPSRSRATLPQTLLAPLTPYRPDAVRFWRHATSSPRRLPVEVPIAVVPGLRLPVIGTSLHLLKESGFDLFFESLTKTHRRLFNLEFHTIDFMDADDLKGTDRELISVQPDLKIPWEIKRNRYTHIFARLREYYTLCGLETAVESLDL